MLSIAGPLSKALAIGFLVSMNLSLGLEVTWQDISCSLRDKSLVCRVLVANLLLVPLLGLALTRVLPMPADFTIAFLLLASAPGAPFSLRYTRRKVEDTPFAAALALLLILSAICFTDPIAKLLLPATAKVSVPFGRVLVVVLIFMVLPVFAGFSLQHWRKDNFTIRKVTSLFATAFFLAWTVLVTTEQSQAVKRIGIRTLAAMLALILGSMIIGWLMGGPKRENRRILAAGTSMRNVALCAVIALESFPGTKVDLGLVAFSALMVTPNTILGFYESYRKRWTKPLAHYP